ncbi:MAG: hypothetical protein AAFQ82_27515, partial [Myxococcota bacterium]
ENYREVQYRCVEGSAEPTDGSRRGVFLSLQGECCAEGVTHFEQGMCVSNTRTCELSSDWSESAEGVEKWSEGTWGACEFDRCPDGEHLEERDCVDNERPCQLASGSGTQIWEGEGWGSCRADQCPSGSHPENGICASDVQPCVVSNGIGEMVWDGLAYGRCIAIGCDVGFQVIEDQCVATFSAREQLVWDTFNFYFGRSPSDVGLEFWTNATVANDVELVAEILIGSSTLDRDYVLANRRVDARNHFLTFDLDAPPWLFSEDEQFIATRFQLYFGRQPEPGGMEFWLSASQLDQTELEAEIILGAQSEDRTYVLANTADLARGFLSDNGFPIPSWLAS